MYQLVNVGPERKKNQRKSKGEWQHRRIADLCCASTNKSLLSGENSLKELGCQVCNCKSRQKSLLHLTFWTMTSVCHKTLIISGSTCWSFSQGCSHPIKLWQIRQFLVLCNVKNRNQLLGKPCQTMWMWLHWSLHVDKIWVEALRNLHITAITNLFMCSVKFVNLSEVN